MGGRANVRQKNRKENESVIQAEENDAEEHFEERLWERVGWIGGINERLYRVFCFYDFFKRVFSRGQATL